MFLTKDRLQVATEQIKNDDVAEQMPRAGVQKHGGDELLGIRVGYSLVADSEIGRDEARVEAFDEKLRDERSRVYADEREQNDPLLPHPMLRRRREFPSRQT